MKNTMYFKSQEELEAYFGGPDKIPSNVLAIVGEPTGDEPAEYVLYTVSNNQSMTGTMQEQGGYITDPADHEKIVQLQEDVAYLDENKADKTQLSYYVTTSYLSEQDYASETYVANYVSEHAGPVDLSAYVTKVELSNASYATTSYVQDKIDAIPGVDLTGYATEAYVTNKIGDLVNSAPETLDTLEELATALGDDPNFATTISTQLGQKANSSDVYTKAEIQAMGYISSIPSEYVTENEISAMGYITISDVPAPDLSAYVTKNELEGMSYITINDVPAQVQADWNITDSSYASFINNKPYIYTSPNAYLTQLGRSNNLIYNNNITVGNVQLSEWRINKLSANSIQITTPGSSPKMINFAEIGDEIYINDDNVNYATNVQYTAGVISNTWNKCVITLQNEIVNWDANTCHLKIAAGEPTKKANVISPDVKHIKGNQNSSSKGDVIIGPGYPYLAGGESRTITHLLCVGGGISIMNKRNVFDIVQDGYYENHIYAYGIGNFDGTNYAQAQDLAYVINDIQTNLGAAASVAEMILGE